MADETLPALPLEGGHHNATRASEECSKGLWRLLTEGDRAGEPVSADEIVRRIARTPALLDEVREVAPRLAARQTPCGPEGVMAVLLPLKSVYGLGDRSEAEWATFWAAYIDALDVLPAECLAEAVIVWNRTGDRFPVPAQLFKLARAEQTKLQMAAWRAKKAAEFRERHSPGPTPEERARVKAMMDEMRGPDGRMVLGGAQRMPGPAPTLAPTPAQAAEALRRAADQEPPI